MRSAVGAALFLALVALFSASVKRELLGVSRSRTTLRPRQEAPPFVLPDTAGNRVELREVSQRNKVVLVNFWATWCGPCRIELPQLERVYRERKERGLEVLAINEDHDAAKLAEFLKEKPLSFPVLVDGDGALAKVYGVDAFPTTVLIDENGRVIQVFDGLQPFLAAALDVHLGRKPSDG